MVESLVPLIMENLFSILFCLALFVPHRVYEIVHYNIPSRCTRNNLFIHSIDGGPAGEFQFGAGLVSPGFPLATVKKVGWSDGTPIFLISSLFLLSQ